MCSVSQVCEHVGAGVCSGSQVCEHERQECVQEVKYVSM